MAGMESNMRSLTVGVLFLLSIVAFLYLMEGAYTRPDHLIKRRLLQQEMVPAADGNLLCVGDDACLGATLNCTRPVCSLTCSGANACKDLDFQCGSESQCTVSCGGGVGACRGATLRGVRSLTCLAPTKFEYPSMDAGHTDVCHGAAATCGAGAPCAVNCTGRADNLCYGISVRGGDAPSLAVAVDVAYAPTCHATHHS